MGTVQYIDAALEQLAPEQRAQFRAWLEAFDAREWDLQIEQDLGTPEKARSTAAQLVSAIKTR